MCHNCLKAKPLTDYNFKRYILMKKLQLPNKSVMIKLEKHYFTITDKSMDLGIDHYWLLTTSPHTHKNQTDILCIPREGHTSTYKAVLPKK